MKCLRMLSLYFHEGLRKFSVLCPENNQLFCCLEMPMYFMLLYTIFADFNLGECVCLHRVVMMISCSCVVVVWQPCPAYNHALTFTMQHKLFNNKPIDRY